MQPPPCYENKDEKPNRYKESKLIITQEDALDALRRVFQRNRLLLKLYLPVVPNSYRATRMRISKTLKVIMWTRNAVWERVRLEE